MIDPVIPLIDEVRLLYHQLARQVEELHKDSGVSAPQRAVLGHLYRHAEATVPAIARARGVTRQHIQGIINDLVDQTLVLPNDNPAHQRSSLFTLTDSGRQHTTELLERERRWMRSHLGDLDTPDLASATSTLAALRERLSKESRP